MQHGENELKVTDEIFLSHQLCELKAERKLFQAPTAKNLLNTSWPSQNTGCASKETMAKVTNFESPETPLLQSGKHTLIQKLKQMDVFPDLHENFSVQTS